MRARTNELELYTGAEGMGKVRVGGLARPGPVYTNPPIPNPTGSSVPNPNSLRRSGVNVAVRLTREHYDAARAAGLNISELLRNAIDAALRQLPRREKIEIERVQLNGRAAKQAVKQLALRRAQDHDHVVDQEAARSKALKQLHPDFLVYTKQVRSWEHQLSWVRSRARPIKALRDLRPEDLLDQLLEAEP